MPDEPKPIDERKTRDSPFGSAQADTCSQRGESTFSLATLMMVVALCAVGFGIANYAVGLGVAFFVIAVLAFARVKLHYHTTWVRGDPVTSQQFALLLLLLPICSGVAFFTNCWAGLFAWGQLWMPNYNHDPLLGFGLGGLTALQVAELVFAFCLRRNNHESP